MKLPRGKIELISLTKCGAGRKKEILCKTSEREDKLKSLTVCGTGRKIEILYETSERED